MPYLQTQVTTQLVIKNNKGDVLLLRRNKPGGLYTLPGGTVLGGETIEQACEREVKEEIGIKVRVGKLARIWQSDHIGTPLLGVVFYAKDTISKNAKIQLTKEHDLWEWFSYQKLMQDKAVDPHIKGEYLKGLDKIY